MSRFGRRRADPVERYLRRLRRWAPRASRDLLELEARRHLYDAVCRLERSGLPPQAARRAAVTAFGPAWRIGLAERGLADHPLMLTLARLAAWPTRMLRHLRLPGPPRRPRSLRPVARLRGGRRPRPRGY